ncbi:MAG: M48 family metallopeptidase [Gammaproteobacteria bacterium]|nr:M48 family metallopeptidase [Gammaproteobacteria bacterium]
MTGIAQKREFKQRVRQWAKKLDVKIVWLGIRPMNNKWASCSTNGHLNFNDELLDLDEELWDYVIVHELLHFFVPNHGRLWKSLMRAHLGDYEKLEESLRVISDQKKRSLADALMGIPRLNTDTDELFKRPAGYSRNVDQS